MRRTPLLLAFFGAVVAILAISSTALAAGKAVGHSKSAQASSTAVAATSKAAPAHGSSSASHSSSSTQSSSGGTSGTKFNCPQPDQDVPGASCDPSSNRGTEQVDHGKGNDCDPGYGGSNPKGTGTDHGNDARYPNSSEDEVPGCGSTSGSPTPPPVVIPPSPVPSPVTSPATGGVLGVSGGNGGGGEVSGAVSGATGVGGAVAGATGVALADTGLRSLGFALLALLLVAVGFLLIRRRGAARTA